MDKVKKYLKNNSKTLIDELNAVQLAWVCHAMQQYATEVSQENKRGDMMDAFRAGMKRGAYLCDDKISKYLREHKILESPKFINWFDEWKSKQE